MSAIGCPTRIAAIAALALAGLPVAFTPALAGEGVDAAGLPPIVLAQRMGPSGGGLGGGGMARPTFPGPAGGMPPPTFPGPATSIRLPDRPPEGRPPRRPWPPFGPSGIRRPPSVVQVGPPPDYLDDDDPPPRRKVAAKRRHEPARKAAAPPARKAASAPVRRAAPPPIRAVQDNRYAPDEVLFELRPDASPAQAGRIARRLRLTILDRSRIELLSTELVRARIPRGSSVPATIRALRAQQVAAAQPNFRYRLQDAAAPATKDDAGLAGIPPADLASAQYTPGKLNLSDAHAIARGRAVLVAVIDSGVDASHPELDGSVAEPVPGKGHVHGTGMAGAIAAHARLVGIAPDVRILDLPAFATAADSGTGLTMEIATALDGAFRHKAQIVNMSFAGPQDDLIQRAVRALNRNGTVLIAAAGNAGPNSPPLYPAAYREVIAVTATDDQDRLYRMANRGGHIGAAAPGVDILVPAPGGGYHQLSGTSLAAAHVTGLAALLIEVRPGLKPDDLRDTLTRTARDLGAPGRDDLFGAGLVDARAAVNALRATALGPAN